MLGLCAIHTVEKSFLKTRSAFFVEASWTVAINSANDSILWCGFASNSLINFSITYTPIQIKLKKRAHWTNCWIHTNHAGISWHFSTLRGCWTLESRWWFHQAQRWSMTQDSSLSFCALSSLPHAFSRASSRAWAPHCRLSTGGRHLLPGMGCGSWTWMDQRGYRWPQCPSDAVHSRQTPLSEHYFLLLGSSKWLTRHGGCAQTFGIPLWESAMS